MSNLVYSAIVLARFWSKVDFEQGDCWLYIGGKDDDGYGRFFLNGRHRRAHQVAWEIEHHQAFPVGLDGMHSCDNPACVRPAHITPATKQQNQADKVTKGRQAMGDNQGLRLHPDRRARGEANGRAILTTDRVTQIKKRLSNGDSQSTIANAFGVSQATISRIKRGEHWRHLNE